MNYGSMAYIGDRFDLIGVDDILLPTNLPYPNGMQSYLISRGFIEVSNENGLVYFHRDGSPRAIVSEWPILGIGKGAQNYAYFFPQVITGNSLFIDDYSIDFLKEFQIIILSGFKWHNQITAEEMIKELAKTGKTVIVDLTHSQEDPVARIPKFLNVWGERIILGNDLPVVVGNGEIYSLEPFGTNDQFWYTITPQGLDQEILTYDFLGQPAVVSGYIESEESRIYFLGLNLMYHIVETHDIEALRIISDLLMIEPFQESNYETIALLNYEGSGKGVIFNYILDTPEKILIPFAHFEGTKVEIDGVRVNTNSLATLLMVDAPAGSHQVSISTEKTPIYHAGYITSLIAILVLTIAGVMLWKEKLK